LVVAVDGPSGSGKSSVCREVARRLGLRYCDTGAMYRAVTWAALDRDIDLEDGPRVAALARGLRIELSDDPERAFVAADGVEITEAIRTSRVSAAVSRVATNLDVRAELVRRQREIAARGGVVMEGRDITTVVAPEAPVRLLLTASEEARLRRRARDVHGTADAAAVAATHDEVVRRDADDSTVATFHTAADGVEELETSTLTFEQVVDAVMVIISQRAGVAMQVRS
jgi:cytidylate kinase